MAVVTYKNQKATPQKTPNAQVYSGFSTQGREFKNPKLYDVELVKQDLLNHFNIRKGEKLENPDFGTNIWSYVFDPLDGETKDLIIQEVEQVRMTILYIGYGLGESINLLFDNQQGLLQGQTQVFSSQSY
jgi:hypothetical protein